MGTILCTAAASRLPFPFLEVPARWSELSLCVVLTKPPTRQFITNEAAQAKVTESVAKRSLHRAEPFASDESIVQGIWRKDQQEPS